MSGSLVDCAVDSLANKIAEMMTKLNTIGNSKTFNGIFIGTIAILQDELSFTGQS